MKELKVKIFIVLLFMIIGFAAVTTNVIVNMTTPINKNPDDFLVYFSSATIDGELNQSLIKNEKSLVFAAEFSTLGDKKTIDYDVTNASKNYDAAIVINCTDSTDYIKVTNTFDTSTDLSATSTRSGKLVVELVKSYVGTELKQNITCAISASAVSRTELGAGTVSGPVERVYDIGSEVLIESERFNIISTTPDTVTMLAQQGLNSSYRQSSSPDYVTFSEANGWSYTPGPMEVDVQQYGDEVKTYVNEYVSYLKEVTRDDSLTGDLITINQLKSLGCTVASNDYSPTDGDTCSSSPYSDWLVNDHWWWTKSAWSNNSDTLWVVSGDNGYLYDSNSYSHSMATRAMWEFIWYDGHYTLSEETIRPTITISKSYFENNMISFTLAGKTYNVPNGTTWADFLASDVNDTSLEPDVDDTIYDFDKCFGHCASVLYNPNNLIFDDNCDVSTAYNDDLISDVYINDFIIRNGIYVVEVVGFGGCPNE